MSGFGAHSNRGKCCGFHASIMHYICDAIKCWGRASLDAFALRAPLQRSSGGWLPTRPASNFTAFAASLDAIAITSFAESKSALCFASFAFAALNAALSHNRTRECLRGSARVHFKSMTVRRELGDYRFDQTTIVHFELLLHAAYVGVFEDVGCGAAKTAFTSQRPVRSAHFQRPSWTAKSVDANSKSTVATWHQRVNIWRT